MDDDVRDLLADMSTHQAGHLPVVAAFLKRIGLARAVNAAVPSQMEVDIGTFVSLMVLDTLSGRSPIYHLEKFASFRGYGPPAGKRGSRRCLQRHHGGPGAGRHLLRGNASDKKINNRVLTELSRHMASHGLAPGAFVYIADSAFVTSANLEAIGDNLFISRLPFTYREADRVIEEAVRKDAWVDVPGEPPSPTGRQKTNYRVFDTTVSLYEEDYRAVEDVGKIEYFCREDASAAADKLKSEGSPLHYPECEVREKVTYCRGRPPKNGERKVSKVRYVLEGELVERIDEVERARAAAECFVLLTNVPQEGEMAHTPSGILAAYKEQYGIERNFGFLKDPLIANDIFLKKPERIEVLGLILLVSLLVWNLMEHVMRAYLKRTNSTIPGWDNKPTRNPTSCMMTIKFMGVLVVRFRGAWYFTVPLTDELEQYVRALGLTEDLLLGMGVYDAGKKRRDQKLPGERR